jgi:hypothetical protein
MKSNNRSKNVLPKWSVLLVLLTVTAVASAQQHKQNAPAAAPHASAPSRPASSAPRAAPAQRPGGNANNAQRPGGNAPNRGPGGASPNNRGQANANNRGPGGASANRPGQAGANNANNRGGANANNRPGANNANNRPGANNTNNRGGANANNRPGANNANNRGGANTNNRPGANNANNRGAANAAKGGAGGANRHQPAGSKTVALKNGGSATFRKDGKVRTVQTHGMTINHGVHGERRIASTHNGRQVVSMGKRGGYSQRAYYSHGGNTYVQRTYYVGGQSYAYGYRSYNYGGYPYYGYAPSYYYGPAYYGWAYNPWPAPVTYGWGWGAQPWYGYYGPYFSPYPVYPTAAFWLTDYLIAANLQAAYAAQAAAESGEVQPQQLGLQSADEIASLWTTDPLIAANLGTAYGPYMLGAAAAKGTATQLSPEVKQAIADQMKQEIAAEQAAAKGTQKAASGDEVPAALDPKIRIFVVSSNLDATTSDGVECGLTPGDVISRTGDTPDDDHMVDATVKSSKKDDCSVGVSVGVDTSDLQEMHNQLRIQMDAGLKTLAEKQGKDGIPAAPDTKTQAGEVPPPAPDTNVANDLQQQKKDADQAEAEAQQPN